MKHLAPYALVSLAVAAAQIQWASDLDAALEPFKDVEKSFEG